MVFYEDNKLLKKAKESSNFLVPNLHTWNVIYPHKQSRAPKAQVHVFENGHFNTTNANLLPKFNDIFFGSIEIINENCFIFYDSGSSTGEEFNAIELAKFYKENNIIYSDTPSPKPINRYTSSYYHDFQNRYDFGGASDIDLVRLGSDNKPTELIESKRSAKVTFDNWSPYKADYGHFNILFNLSTMHNLRATIAFHYWENYKIEKINKIKMYEIIDIDKPKFLNVVNLEEFLNCEY
mgnify:FL=1